MNGSTRDKAVFGRRRRLCQAGQRSFAPVADRMTMPWLPMAADPSRGPKATELQSAYGRRSSGPTLEAEARARRSGPEQPVTLSGFPIIAPPGASAFRKSLRSRSV
jgi:hypothetical protein